MIIARDPIHPGEFLAADMALRLSQWLGTFPDLWMNLQTLYGLRLAEQQSGEEIKRTVARWQSPSERGAEMASPS